MVTIDMLRLAGSRIRHSLLAAWLASLACSSPRLFYVTSELPKLEERPDLDLIVGPGPWPTVRAVLSDSPRVPDELVLSTLRALMTLPGAMDACDASGRPRPDATEYCVALYRTPRDWRVTWPIRKLVEAQNSCKPPFGGVDDKDFGRGLPVFGYAHNHPCGLFASSTDLIRFPTTKSPEGIWVVVSYATTPNGEPVHDLQGQLIPAWHWLATGHEDQPRFYKWDAAGKVFRWNEDKKQWEFQALCQPQASLMINPKPLPPKCSPELVDWY